MNEPTVRSGAGAPTRARRRGALRTSAHLARLLTVRVADERFAVVVADIERVVRREPPRRVPDALPWIDGAVVHGDALLPVIDLRARLGLPVGEWGARARTLVVRDVNGAFGVSVDEVLDVLPVEDEAVRPAPSSVRGLSGEYLRGLARLDGEAVLVLDLARLVSSEERLALDAAVAACAGEDGEGTDG